MLEAIPENGQIPGEGGVLVGNSIWHPSEASQLLFKLFGHLPHRLGKFGGVGGLMQVLVRAKVDTFQQSQRSPPVGFGTF